MSLLMPETGLLFWMLLSFSVVFFLLAKFGFPIILKQANERKAFVDQSLADAREINVRMGEIDETIQRLLLETKAEQQAIMRNAEESRKRIIEQAQHDAKVYADKKIIELHTRLEEERRQAVESLRAEVVGLSVDIAERLIKSQLADKPAQIHLIERMLDEHAKSIRN